MYAYPRSLSPVGRNVGFRPPDWGQKDLIATPPIPPHEKALSELCHWYQQG